MIFKSILQFRKKLADALNAADAGEIIVIERLKADRKTVTARYMLKLLPPEEGDI